MVKSKATPQTEVSLQQYTKLLLRDDLQDYLREMYALWKCTCIGVQGQDAITRSTAALAGTYSLSTTGSPLFVSYRLATQARQLAQHCKPQDAKLNLESVCLRRLYGDQWTQISAKAQKRIRKDFRDKLRAGSNLDMLVARFGSGILLTCSSKAHQK
jgi:hypothetical protein